MHENFYCIIGGDGFGKSTLLEALKKKHPNIAIVHWKQFESVTQICNTSDESDPASKLLKLGRNARSAQLFYLAALEYDMEIQPRVQAGNLVIVDSYWYKFAAKMKVLNLASPILYTACKTLPSPKGVICLETPLDIAESRKPNFNKLETDENGNFGSFQHNIGVEMSDFTQDIPKIIIDGTQPLKHKLDTLLEGIAKLAKAPHQNS